jgi:hypothetical protein
MWCFVSDVNTAHVDRPSRGFLHSTDDIKQGGLACTVGANKTSHFAGLNIQVHATNCHHATEANHDSAYFKK